MEDQGSDPKRIIFIQVNKDQVPDAEMMAWLESFMNQVYLDSFSMSFDESPAQGDPSPMEEIEYIDSIVSGDHIPEAFDMIMNAFYKHEGKAS